MDYTEQRRGVQIKTLLYNFKRTQCDVQCFWDIQNVDTSENLNMNTILPDTWVKVQTFPNPELYN